MNVFATRLKLLAEKFKIKLFHAKRILFHVVTAAFEQLISRFTRNVVIYSS